MKHLTIRGASSELAQALDEVRRGREISLNRTVLDLLERALSVGSHRRSNGLAALAGTWSEEELEQFETATAVNRSTKIIGDESLLPGHLRLQPVQARDRDGRRADRLSRVDRRVDGCDRGADDGIPAEVAALTDTAEPAACAAGGLEVLRGAKAAVLA